MAQAVPSVPLVPTKPSAPHHGVHHPASKAAPHHGETAHKAKFQTLLEKAAPKAHQASPKAVAVPEAPKPASVKAKTPETQVEKPKETKKTPARESKDPKQDAAQTALAAGLLHPNPGKVEAPRAPKPEGDGVGSPTDKQKVAPKADKKPGTEIKTGNLIQTAQASGAAQGTQGHRKLEKTEEKPKVFVVDRRTDAKEKEKLKRPADTVTPPVTATAEPQSQVKTGDTKASADQPIVFQTVAGRTPDGFDLKPQSTPVASRDAATFQQFLVEKGYGQLVDQARIVLKDNNAGEIRMTLHPESLGKVKVSLNLNDNSLAGQIFVENQTVKDVFQSNMDGLLQSFRDGGFSDLSLQVSVGNGNGGGNAGQGQPQTAAQARDYGRQVTQTAAMDPRTDRIGSWNDRQINLTA